MSKEFQRAKKDADILEYKKLLVLDGWERETRANFAKALGVTERTLYLWDREIDWAWVRDTRRERFARLITQIDSALFNKAVSEDVPAIKLAYERFDGYVPAQSIDLNAKSDKELLELAAKLKEESEGSKGPDAVGGTGKAKA